MLSRQEQRVLDEIEQRLAADAPRLAAMMAGPMRIWSPKLAARAHDATLICAFLLAGLCLAVSAVGAAFVAALFGCLVFVNRRAQFPPDSDAWWAKRRFPH